MDADLASVHDVFARARQMYVDGVLVKEISIATGLKERQVYSALEGGPFVAAGQRMFPEIKRNRIIRRKAQPKPRQSARADAVAKLWKSAEKRIADIHKRLRKAGVDADERERDTRMLAVMVKTLRELAALDDKKAATHDERRNDQPDTRDIDEFRRDLARRIDALVAQQSGETGGGTGGA